MNLKSLWATILSLLLIVGCSRYKISLPSPDQKGEVVIAFQNVNLVPMTDEKIVKNQTVLVKGKRIVEIGSSKTVAVPANSKLIDGTGAYLMPGLADMHMHTRDNWDDWLSIWPVSPFNLYLANGVTTIRNFGPEEGSRNYVLGWRDKINNGRLIGPNIYTSGPIIYGPVLNPQKTVRKQITKGYDFIKLYSFLSREDFYNAMITAKQASKYTAGHIPFQVGLQDVLSEGMDEIAHVEELAWEFVDFDKTKGLTGGKWMTYVIHTAYRQFKPYLGLNLEELDGRYGKAALSLARKVYAADVPVCTTLFLDEVIVEKLSEPERFLSKPENRYLPRSYIAAFKQGREKHQMQVRGGEDFASFKRRVDRILLKYLKEAGVSIVLGSDAGTGWMGLVPGFSIHEELRVLTENGFTPYEAIKTGTVNAALVTEKMNARGDFGTLEIGKRADLILVENNPLEDIANIKKIIGVMAAGRWYSNATLKDMIALK
ncbi:MAG: amidohydrolase family protein [Deltaproteobacteria bacterium]|nr:MAG: amidohydrolase family protein [Deltaproteobacteria bacterium]